MASAYPGELERQKCASRTRDELVEYRPARPMGLRDELRMKGMLDRCSFCGACPLIIKALQIMAPKPALPPSAEVFRLAG